ncbi:MAG TPA: hypothetical protein VJW93_11215 [Candidatus Acidoferrales bacterium]|nr:hypothetical protein [Candidatus Acidoferrales bacterium]
MMTRQRRIVPDAVLGAQIVLGIVAAILAWFASFWLFLATGAIPLHLFERQPYQITWNERLSWIACFVVAGLVFWLVARAVSRFGPKPLTSTKL